MGRWVVAVLGVPLVLLVGAGCGDSSDDPTPTETTPRDADESTSTTDDGVSDLPPTTPGEPGSDTTAADRPPVSTTTPG